MNKDIICVIDAGTTGLRTMLFDIKGNELARAYEEYKSYFPKPAWVEQEANDWWQAVCNTSNKVVKQVNVSSIIGISVTNQRETIVPVDESGNPLRKALIWQDRRTIPECNYIKEVVGEDEIYKITGLTIDPYFSSSKILHIKQKQPNIFSKTHKFLLVHDFIEMKLSDKFITDWSNASRTMLFDIEKHDWSEKICTKLEIPIKLMPKPYPSGEIIGEVTKKAAKESGFEEGTPIISGGGDQQLGALGLGVTKSGQISCTTGTGTFVSAFLDKPLRDNKKRLLCSCHAIPNAWVMEASIFTTGSIYRWFRDQFSQYEKEICKKQDRDPYEFLNEEAAKSPVGANGVILLPHFAGAGAPHWNPYSRGVIAGLALGHSRSDIIRAIMESICFEIRKNIEIMEKLNINIEQVRITGGLTRSSFFNQIQADIYGVSVLRSKTEEATALGAAMLVLKGCKIYKDYEEIAENLVQISEKKESISKNHQKYNKIFEISKKIYEIFQKNNIFNEIFELAD